MTLVPTRKTPAGQEYWDKVNKKTVLYPNGHKPEAVQTEGMVGQYSASGKVATLAKGEEVIVPSNKRDGLTAVELDVAELDIDGLREYAESKNVEIPGNMKKLETIRNHIIEELKGAADAQ